MSDFLLELSANPQARRMVKSLGLPLPMPEPLRRATGPWEARPLDDEKVVVVGQGQQGGGVLGEALGAALARAGAEALVVGEEADLAPYLGPSEAWARPATRVAPGEAPQGVKVAALVFDATGIETPAGLRALYDGFHPWIGALKKTGRVVVIGRPPEDTKDPAAAAVRAGLDGFTRSVAKELGRKGSTANVVYVAEGAEDRLAPVLHWLLSARSAYVTAQPLRVTTAVSAPKDVPLTRPLEGKVVLVTGAARGIGAATAAILADQGAHVVCLDRPADDGPTSQVARSIGGSVLLADITDPEAPEKISTILQDKHGGVDVVIHNAGVTRDKTLARMKPELWDQAVDINLGAVVRITERLVDDGVLHDHGRVICLSSVSGIAGNVGQTNYAASKAGIVGYVKALSASLAKRGITVNAIAPGFIETRLTNAMPVMIREAARRLSALGQGGQPEDVGQATTFLATPGAYGITGSVLRVCGGALVGA